MSKKFFVFLSIILSAAILTGAGCIQFGSSTTTGPVGMYRSPDKGETWLPITALPTAQGVKSIAGVKVYRTFTDPGDPNALYVGSRGQGLFYTYNKGDSWQSAAPLSGRFIYSVAVDPSNKCIIYVTDGPSIYKTIDCSRSWRLVYSEQRPTEHLVGLAIDYGNPKTVYAGLVGGDIIRSSDSGDSWQTVKRFGFELQQISTDPLAGKRLYIAARRKGLWRSDDSGENWSDLSGQLSAFNDSTNFYRLVLHPSQKNSLFWISKYGILRSDDAGQTWKDLKLITPPGSVNIYAFAISPANEKEMYYVGTILGENSVNLRSTFYKTVDGGETWITKKLPTNTVPITLNIPAKDPNMLMMGFTVLTQ